MTEVEKRAKTRKEIVDLHNKQLAKLESDLERAEGVIQIKTLNVKFAQKENEKWIRVEDVVNLKNEFPHFAPFSKEEQSIGKRGLIAVYEDWFKKLDRLVSEDGS